MNISGSGHIPAGEYNEKVSISGSGKIDGNLRCLGLSCSGSVHGIGEIECAEVVCSGGADVGGGIEAESFRSAGRVVCGGLLNAEKIDISLDGIGSRIGSIGGSDVRIHCERTAKKITRMPLFAKLVGGVGGNLTVDEWIEGDTVAVEFVHAPKVVGRVVAIGADCECSTARRSKSTPTQRWAPARRFNKTGTR